jgi:hypothetical protein
MKLKKKFRPPPPLEPYNFSKKGKEKDKSEENLLQEDGNPKLFSRIQLAAALIGKNFSF